jgi:hypothetical protein
LREGLKQIIGLAEKNGCDDPNGIIKQQSESQRLYV